MTKKDKELVRKAIYSAKDSIVFGGNTYKIGIDIGINDYISRLTKKIEAIPIDADDPEEDDLK